MKRFFRWAPVCLFASMAFAGDELPSVVNRKANHVPIYAIDNVSVASQGRDGDRPFGVVNVNVTVEGNICGAEGNTLALNQRYNQEGFYTVALSVAHNYIPRPNVLSACAAFSRRSQVTIPLEITPYTWNARSEIAYHFDLNRDGLNGTDARTLQVIVERQDGKIKVRVD